MGWLKDTIELCLSAGRNIGKDWFHSLFQRTAARARGWTVDEWYPLDEAVIRFADEGVWLPEWIKARSEGINISKQLPLLSESEAELKEKELAVCERRAEKAMNIVNEGLREYLVDGELIARGFREPFSHGAPYLTISRHEWRVLQVILPNRAEGGGIGYVALTIGEPGTKPLFHRRRRNPTAALRRPSAALQRRRRALWCGVGIAATASSLIPASWPRVTAPTPRFSTGTSGSFARAAAGARSSSF